MSELVALLLKTLLTSLDLLVKLLTFGWIGSVKKALTKKVTRSVPLASDVSHRVHVKVVDRKLIGSFSPDISESLIILVSTITSKLEEVWE